MRSIHVRQHPWISNFFSKGVERIYFRKELLSLIIENTGDSLRVVYLILYRNAIFVIDRGRKRLIRVQLRVVIFFLFGISLSSPCSPLMVGSWNSKILREGSRLRDVFGKILFDRDSWNLLDS